MDPKAVFKFDRRQALVTQLAVASEFPVRVWEVRKPILVRTAQDSKSRFSMGSYLVQNPEKQKWGCLGVASERS